MTRLFVYGSLMAGEPNAGEIAGARLLGPARTAAAFTLVDLGAFPGLLTGGDTAVAGELYEIDPARLRQLDAFESDGVPFRRAAIRLDDGAEAWAYLLAVDREAGALPIRSGDWRKR